MVSKDVLKFFHNLLQGGDGTSAKKLEEDLDILCASKGDNVDLSKWSKDDFSTDFTPDYIDCKYFASKPVANNNFGLCSAAKEKFYRHFLATTFFHLATEKKILVASWCLPKNVNFGPWMVFMNVEKPCEMQLTSFCQLNTILPFCMSL